MDLLLPNERPPMDIFVTLERTRFGTVRAAFRVIIDHIETAVHYHPEFTVGQMLQVAQQYTGLVRVHVLDPQPLHTISMNWTK